MLTVQGMQCPDSRVTSTNKSTTDPYTYMGTDQRFHPLLTIPSLYSSQMPANAPASPPRSHYTPYPTLNCSTNTQGASDPEAYIDNLAVLWAGQGFAQPINSTGYQCGNSFPFETCSSSWFLGGDQDFNIILPGLNATNLFTSR